MYSLAIGVDEAGRGPLAGPVVAAAVWLPENFSMHLPLRPRMTDSKKLSAAARQTLAAIIYQHAQVALGISAVRDIEKHNILGATMIAMQRAVTELKNTLDKKNILTQSVLVDGNKAPKFDEFNTDHVKCIIGGDAIEPAISAASIIAKTARDDMMMQLHAHYPQYGFDQHMGYGTAAHRGAIQQYGPCPEHRALFLRKILVA